MKKLYWIAITVGIISIPFARELAIRQMGYAAIGGEFFIIPLLMLIVLLFQQMYELILAVKNMEEKSQ